MRHTLRSTARIALAAVVVIVVAVAAAGPAGAIADPRDRPEMQKALSELLSFAAPGRQVRYQSPVTGNGGAITALESVGRGTWECWDYERTFELRGRVMLVDGTACEVEPGLWQIQDESEARASPTPVPSPQAQAQTQIAPAATRDRALVRETQLLLAELGYAPGPADGAYGRRTGAAIEAYQRDTGLVPTGVPSAELLDRLRAARQVALPQPQVQPLPEAQPQVQAQPQPAPGPAVNAAPDPTRDRAMVRETQALLAALGYRPGPADGAYGRRTGAAIEAYQRDTGLVQTGLPSADLLIRLRANLRAAQPQVQSQPAPAPGPAPAPAPGPAPSGNIVVPPPPPPAPVPQ